MSNYLAIATVTATLQKVLQSAIQADVEGARVTTVRPDVFGKGTPETGVNIFLYQVAPVNWRNADLPTRRSTGEVLKRPQIALNLNYIFTFYGNEVEMEPQRLLGSVVRTLHSRPVLSQELIENTISDTTFRYLRSSDLAEQVESVKFMLQQLSTEDLSKIWSVFFQTPYSLSVAYQGSTVLIESEDTPQRALPVRSLRTRVVPYQPVLREIVSLDEVVKTWQGAANPPILASSAIEILGKRLQGEVTTVQIGEAEISPQDVSENKISINLATFSSQVLRAGVQGLQVIHYSAQIRQMVQSNVLPFLLFPTLKAIQVTNIVSEGDNLCAAVITVLTNPAVGKNQRAILMLNELSTTNPAEYTFKISPRQADTDTLVTNIHGVKAGEYLVRLQIDRVESLLTVDTDTNSPTFEQYIAPKIAIP